MSKTVKQATIRFAEFDDENVAVAVPQQTGKQKYSLDALIEGFKKITSDIRVWYATPQEAYSTIAGQDLSPKGLVRVNLMTLALVIVAVCAMENVVLTGVTTASVAWLVYHAKRNGKQGVAQSRKKGGK